MNDKTIILASASPRRYELLKQLGTTMEDLYKQKEESERKEDNLNDANQNFS